MAVLRFNIEYADETTVEASFLPKQQVQYEMETGDPIASSSDEILVTKLYKMAWFAAGKPRDDFDDWLDDLVSVEALDSDDDGDVEGSTRPT